MTSDAKPQETWCNVVPSSTFARAVPIVALLVFGTLFARHIAALDGPALRQALESISFWQWSGAVLCTALSFRAIGTYDVLVHGLLQTGQPPSAMRKAGMCAIALSQTLGFGVVTGAMVRWRCLPDLKFGAVLRLSGLVSISFLAALAALASLIVPLSDLTLLPFAIIGGALALAALSALAGLAHKLGWLERPLRKRTIAALFFGDSLRHKLCSHRPLVPLA